MLVANDTAIATTAAGDARWLNSTGDLVGGNGITIQENTPSAGQATINQELLI